jgi:hypothetical protein
VTAVQSWCGSNITEKVNEILTDLEPCRKACGYDELNTSWRRVGDYVLVESSNQAYFHILLYVWIVHCLH